MTKRIGIYPGAFDPIHKGHLAFAAAAQARYKLDKIFFLPEPNPTHKQGVKALEHRANMVHLATANQASFGVMVLDAQEFDIRHFWPRVMARFLGSELYMLIGNNPVKRLGEWPHTTEFGKQAPTFVIAMRSQPLTDVAETIETLLETKKLELPFSVLDAHYQTYDAATVRRALRSGAQPEEVPQSVMEYIQRNKLYISGAI